MERIWRKGSVKTKTWALLARAILGPAESPGRPWKMEVSATAEELAPNLSSLAGPVLAARLISRAGRPAPPGRDALQPSADHGCGEVSLQASERPCSFAQARHHLPPSCRDRISEKAPGKDGARSGRKAGHSRPAGLLWGGTVTGSARHLWKPAWRYQAQRTE